MNSFPLATSLPTIDSNNINKVIVKIGEIELRTVVNMKCSYSLLGLTTRQFSVTCEGFTDEFRAVRDMIKQKDTNFVYIYLIDTDSTPNNVIYFLRGYIPWANLITQGTVDQFTWQISGYDIFGSLHESQISKSTFVNPPIALTTIIGNVLEELNYVSVTEYTEVKTRYNDQTVIDFKINLLPNGTPQKKLLNLQPGVTRGSQLVEVDEGVPASELIYTPDSNFPRPYNMSHIKADEYLQTILQLKNLYLLSNGVDALRIVKPGVGDAILTGELLLEYGKEQTNIFSYSKGNLQSGNFMRGLPSYSMICSGMNSLNNSTGNSPTTGGDLYSSGYCFDPRAIPHLQSVYVINNIPASSQDMSALADAIANTRRAVKSSGYTYVFKGSFFNNGTLYAPNQLLKVTDYVHDYQDLMLIEEVVFEYSVTTGSEVMLGVVPQNSFSYLTPEQLLKNITAKKAPKKNKIIPRAVN